MSFSRTKHPITAEATVHGGHSSMGEDISIRTHIKNAPFCLSFIILSSSRSGTFFGESLKYVTTVMGGVLGSAVSPVCGSRPSSAPIVVSGAVYGIMEWPHLSKINHKMDHFVATSLMVTLTAHNQPRKVDAARYSIGFVVLRRSLGRDSL